MPCGIPESRSASINIRIIVTLQLERAISSFSLSRRLNRHDNNSSAAVATPSADAAAETSVIAKVDSANSLLSLALWTMWHFLFFFFSSFLREVVRAVFTLI